MVIAHNITALNTYKSLGIASNASNKSMEKLSSGYRINRAGDDAAGLSISEKMRSQIRGLNRASRNAQDGISMIQTAEGALNEQHSILQRMRELAVQSASDTNQTQDREALQNEMAQLTSEINRIGNTTEFNGMKLLNGEKQSTVDKTTATTTTVAKGGTVESFSNAKGVTTDGTAIKIASGITISESDSDNVDVTKLQAAAGKNTIVVTKNGSNDGFTVDIALAEADGTTPADAGVNTLGVDAEKMVKNDDGSFTYDNHGISFTISKEDADAAFAASGTVNTKIDLFAANNGAADTAVDALGGAESKKYGTIKEYDASSSTDNLTVRNFKLSEFENGGNRLDHGYVEIEATADGSASADATKVTLTVTFKDKATGGADLVKDTVVIDATKLATDDKFTYNANGLEFTLDASNFSVDQDADAGKKMKLAINLDEKMGTENVVTGGTKVDNAAYFHVGANSNQTISMDFGDMRAASLGLVGNGSGFASTANVTDGVTGDPSENSLNITTRADANTAITKIDDAIKMVSEERSKYGAIQNRLEYTINNLNTTAENMQAAESRIRDVDMASEMMEMTKNNILQQAAQAMLVQANQRPQQALQLLQ